ncbi:hypothetical protein EK21DRAFT_21454, partial [Setomelanomma holmii]
CTGANDHIPWAFLASLINVRVQKGILMIPEYPLGPEHNEPEIGRALQEFLEFYKCDYCFEEGFDSWREWLLNRVNIENLKFGDQIYAEGESAGGRALITILFKNADINEGTHLPIRVDLDRFGMLGHYTR